MDDVIKIAVGVFIGALAALLTYEGIQTVRAELALRQLNQQAQRTMQNLQRQEADRRAAESDQQARDQAAAQQQQRADNDAREWQLYLKGHREKAWAQFFQPSAKCRQDSGTMECANTYMAAKRRFDQQYQPPVR